MNTPAVPTKRSLIKKASEYPDVEVDRLSSEQNRTILYDNPGEEYHNPRGIPGGRFGPNHRPVDRELGIYPNITRTGGARINWDYMPATTINGGPLDKPSTYLTTGPYHRPELFREAEIYPGDENYSIVAMDKHQNRRPLKEQAYDFPVIIRDYYVPLKRLADYAARGGEMTMKEKEALLYCLQLLGKPSPTFEGGKALILPEVFTRFINPLGTMGDVPSYKGLTAYFYDLGNRLQHFSEDLIREGKGIYTYRDPNKRRGFMAPADNTERNINNFFKLHKEMNLPEAARLLGLGAKQWGIDKVKSPEDAERISQKMERFYTYLFISEAVQCIKERAYGDNPHPLLSIDKDDMNTIEAYGSGMYNFHGLPPLQAERDLIEEIGRMIQPGSMEHAEITRLREGGDATPRKGQNDKYRIYQYDLSRERYHAMNYLFDHDGEGNKFLFSR